MDWKNYSKGNELIGNTGAYKFIKSHSKEVLQPHGPILRRSKSRLFDREKEVSGGLSSDGRNDVLYVLLGTDEPSSLPISSVSKENNIIPSVSGARKIRAMDALILLLTGVLLPTSDYTVLFVPILMMKSVSSQYVNQPPLQTTRNGIYRYCPVQNNIELSDGKHWRYTGKDGCLNLWNSKMCTVTAKEAMKDMICGESVSSKTQLCNLQETQAVCAAQIQKIMNLIPPTCPRMKENADTMKPVGWLYANHNFPPSQADLDTCKNWLKKFASLSPEGECTASYVEGSGYEINVGGDDLDQLIEVMALVERTDPKITLNISSTKWLPGKPIECFKNTTSNEGVLLQGLVNECPGNLTATNCEEKCWKFLSSEKKFLRNTPAGSCCIQNLEQFSEQKVKDLCAMKPDAIVNMDVRTCGSTKYYIYGCDEDCFEDRFAVWISEGSPKVTEKNRMMTVDCDKVSALGYKYNQSFVRTYRDKCGCVEDELCFKENGLTKKIGLDFATERDRMDGSRCMKIIVRSYNGMVVNRDFQVSNFILTEFGVRSNFLSLEFNSICDHVLVKNNPIMLDTSTPDLRTLSTSRSSSGQLISPTRNDIPIVTSVGNVFIDKCLSEMNDGSKTSYDRRVECSKNVEDKLRSQKLEIASLFLGIMMIIYLFYLFLLRSSLNKDSDIMIMLWPVFKMWQIASCSSNKDIRAASESIFSKEKFKPKWKNMSLAAVDLMSNIVKNNSFIVHKVTNACIWCPMLLLITLPLGFVIGIISILCSLPNWFRGVRYCEDESGKKWCFFTATSYLDMLSKLLFLHMVHCPMNCVKDGVVFKVSVMKAVALLLFFAACMYAYMIDLVVLPLASAASIGQTLNLAGQCDGVVCKSLINFNVDIKIATGNYVEFPLNDGTKTIGKITIIHTGMTRKFTGSYKHSQPEFAERYNRAVCKSVNGDAYSDMGSCWKYWNEGPLDKGESCSGSAGGGNFAMGSNWEYMNKPMYCKFYTPKGFAWGWSVSEDGHEFIGISYTQKTDSPVIRQYTMNEGVLHGSMRIKIEINGEITFDEEINSDALFDTTTFEQYNAQVTLRESYGSSKTLAGNDVACFFRNPKDVNPEFCTIYTSSMGDRSVLRTYGERSDELSCGIMDYTDWQLNRASTQGYWGSDVQNIMRTVPAREDLQRDSQSIVSTTSCSFKAISSGDYKKATEWKCSNRNYKGSDECWGSGNVWDAVTTCLPSELEITLSDCSVAAVNVMFSATMTYSIDGGSTNVINPSIVKLQNRGCFGISNRAMMSLTTDGTESGIIRIRKDNGIDCPSIAYLRSGSVTINCTAYYSDNTTLSLLALDGTSRTMTMSPMEKCKSYSFDNGNVGNVNPNSIMTSNDYLLWAALAGVIFLLLIVLLILICFCFKVAGRSTVQYSSMAPPQDPMLNFTTRALIEEFNNRQKVSSESVRQRVRFDDSEKGSR